MATRRLSLILVAVAAAAYPGLGGHLHGQASDASPSPAPVASGAIIAMGYPFALEVGQTAVLQDGLMVRFVSVVADSRCPADVQCVWEGNAEIAMEVAATDESPATSSLNTNPGFATEAMYLGYRIALIDLEPYPSTTSKSGEPYRATLTVDALESRWPS